MNVDLTNAAAKKRLRQTCWEVQTRAEIRNAATVLAKTQKRLGSNGIDIPVSVTARKSKAVSVQQSKKFAFEFLCTYWDVPQNSVADLHGKICDQQASNFVSFCL